MLVQAGPVVQAAQHCTAFPGYRLPAEPTSRGSECGAVGSRRIILRDRSGMWSRPAPAPSHHTQLAAAHLEPDGPVQSPTGATSTPMMTRESEHRWTLVRRCSPPRHTPPRPGTTRPPARRPASLHIAHRVSQCSLKSLAVGERGVGRSGAGRIYMSCLVAVGGCWCC